ncbi:MAG TPA: tyrosine/phenylalanine carboxypeptidase domain-containing protein [Gemmatimonadaceae bacterium]|nr:tyrosine/phenylalanine carboxypeptidase domain-containing protein [Gemmatimonadaceae bacterium]
MSGTPAPEDRQVEKVVARLAAGQRVRRTLDGGLRLHVERPLPFLVLYRARESADDADLSRLVTSGASWLIAPGAAHAEVSGLLAAITRVMGRQFGAFLLAELWEAPRDTGGGAGVRRPAFTISAGTLAPGGPTITQLRLALCDIPLRPRTLDVVVDAHGPGSSPVLAPLALPDDDAYTLHRLGLALQPPYRQRGTGIAYPVVYRVLRRGLTTALRKTAYHFAVTHTSFHPAHIDALGPRRASAAVKRADEALAGIAESFDFLLQVTPVNLDRAWAEFSRRGGETPPEFDYRPLVVDAAMVKRTLYSVATEEIEDPTLAHLLEETRDFLDRKITMLTDRGTSRFLYGSLQLYGPIEDALLEDARALLAAVGIPGESPGERLDAEAVRRLAEEELAWYRARVRSLEAAAVVRGDVSGLMVSKGDLLIGASVSIAPARARALVQHEVGTHVLTHHNGRVQPLRLLASGLAGYEELQEGLAVLAEWMIGGLNASRLRLLGGRVVAAHLVASGAGFVDAWRALTRDYGFAPHAAFTMCARVFRSGGLTKDTIYLRGLVRLLRYLANGGALDVLFIGKIAFEQVEFIGELRWRGVLREPALLPRYLGGGDAEARLARLRGGMTVMDLLDGEEQ